MQAALFVILIVLMIGAAGAVAWGLVNMVRNNGEVGVKTSNKLMQMRVVLQAAALIVFALFLILMRQ